ncbi:fungal Zn binuclear cluster domain-containing protein [Colletotrichum somersetense]|nr:fungal Zn binuclear cluster domain-containing protein [Colletotrichum somersetense]
MEKRTRRLGHKKSRNGCQRCKARRVKCDEGRPCQKCVAHGVHCSLLDHPAAPLTVPAATSPAPSKPSEPVPIRPAYGHHGAASEASLTPTAVNSTSSPYPAESAPDRHNPAADPWDLSEDWMLSLRLMHHYSTNTRHILPKDACTEELWKTTIPEMACSHKFLMHGLLALAALHYADLHPQERKKWDIISVHHQNLALRFFALRLTHLDKDNCEAYFLLATLIFVVSLCSVAHSDSLGRTVSLDDVAQSFMLLHGVKGILDFQPIEAWRERGGPLEALLRAPVLPPGRSWSSSPFQRRLDAVTTLAREVPASFTALINPQSVCVLALESLRRTHLVCKSGAGGANAVWGWSTTLPPLFVEMIGNRHPTALVILAHYAAMAWPCEKGDWVSDGWSAAVMGLVDGALDDDWRPWIEWPKRSLTEKIEVDDMEV